MSAPQAAPFAQAGANDQGRKHAEMADALRAMLQLVEDGDLVRNTTKDGDGQHFVRQGMRIVGALQKARAALGESSQDKEPA